jgi:NhaP-type Na+/H+ or K+/H+ antiporter
MNWITFFFGLFWGFLNGAILGLVLGMAIGWYRVRKEEKQREQHEEILAVLDTTTEWSDVPLDDEGL